MKTILVSTIIDKVKEKLHTYFEKDMVDDGILYNKFENLKSNFRLNDLEDVRDVLIVENYKVDLPDDFYKANILLGCFEAETYNTSRYDETWTLEEQEVCELNVCETVCDVCTDECGNLMRIVQKFNRTAPEVYTKFDVLSLSRSSLDFCSNICPNKKSNSGNRIEIKNGQIITEFECGMIYIEYLKSMDIGTDYEIPYHPKVVQWLESAFILEVFETLYYNGTENILQRFQNAQRQANTDYWSAKSVMKTPEVDELYRVSKALTDRYNRIRYNIWDNVAHGETYYSYRPGYPTSNNLHSIVNSAY